MAEGATRRYFEEILEVTSVAKRGVERLGEIRRMPEAEFKSFIEDLWSRVRGHNERNFEQIIESLRRYEGQPKAFYFGAPFALTYLGEEGLVDRFIKKATLYYGKVVVTDPVLEVLAARDFYTTEALRDSFVPASLASFATLRPWVEAGLVEVLPDASRWDEALWETTSKLADEDYEDEGWASQKGALRDEDRGLEGEGLIEGYERLVQAITPQKVIDEKGGLRNCALGVLLKGSSRTMAGEFFGGALTDSSPTTDRRQAWRLFGLWSSKRAELLVQRGLLDEATWRRMKQEAMAGRVWEGLKVERLGALMKLSPKEIIKVRDDSRYSFKSYRELVGEEIGEVETAKLGDEKEIEQIISQVSKTLNREARTLRGDLKNIESKFGVSVALAPLSLFLSLLPFPLAKLAGMLIDGVSLKDLYNYISDKQEQKERSGYFLARLEDEAEEQRILREHGVTSKWHL